MILEYSTFKSMTEPRMKRCVALFVSIIVLVIARQSHAEYIAQMDIRQADTVDRVYIKLLESAAPLTVQNFLNYVRDGDYSKSFIHRSISGFVVQGGGYTFDPALNGGAFVYDAANNLYPGGLQEVLTDPPVINEFGNSNLRGSLAMAKVGERYEDSSGLPCIPPGPNCTLVPGTGPDTATSQWFVNLTDNSVNLDVQNGGFTVFAEVLGSGMGVFDTIASRTAYNRTDIHPLFATLPLLGYVSDPVTSGNLVLIDTISEVLAISPDIAYGVVTPGSNLQPEVVIENRGNESVIIGDIGAQVLLAPPFSIVSDLCSKKTLSPGQRCSLIVLFSPAAPGLFEDSFDIDLPGLGVNYLVKLSGEGGPVVTEADIASTFSSVDFGERDVFYSQDAPPYSHRIFINNFGGLQLDFIKIALSATSDAEFSLSGTCFDVTTLLNNEFCYIDILYLPQVAASHSATLVIDSNDPDESTLEIPVFAVALTEMDGVDANVEDAASNNGDGNNDDLLDSRQSYVASLPDLKGTYMTYVSEVNKPFSAVRIVDQSLFVENQEGVVLSAGVHEFTLNNINSAEVVEIGLLFPANVEPSAYYIYSSSSSNPLPHWHKFDFDGETGVSFLGSAQVISPKGKIVERNVIRMLLKNGGRGDSSGLQDNILVVRSAINYKPRSSGGAQSLSCLLILVLTLVYLRNSRYHFLVKSNKR